jgi:ribosomal protein S27AE
MESSTENWTCSGCGAPIETASSEPRQQCPKCGSLARTAHVSIAETITVNAYLKTHTKHRDGGTKVVREVIEGDNYHRTRGKWDIVRRVIDRANNRYEETFRDRDTGEIVPPHKAEPLTEHRKPKAR